MSLPRQTAGEWLTNEATVVMWRSKLWGLVWACRLLIREEVCKQLRRISSSTYSQKHSGHHNVESCYVIACLVVQAIWRTGSW